MKQKQYKRHSWVKILKIMYMINIKQNVHPVNSQVDQVNKSLWVILMLKEYQQVASWKELHYEFAVKGM